MHKALAQLTGGSVYGESIVIDSTKEYIKFPMPGPLHGSCRQLLLQILYTTWCPSAEFFMSHLLLTSANTCLANWHVFQKLEVLRSLNSNAAAVAKGGSLLLGVFLCALPMESTLASSAAAF